MTVVGVDDTDSRERGMCTTYLADRITARLSEPSRILLVRLNPAVPHKTRGNAAIAIHCRDDPGEAYEIAREVVASTAETTDPETHPGLVVAPEQPSAVPTAVERFAREAMHVRHDLRDALDLADGSGYRVEGWKRGRGRIGALAAIGAWAAGDDWTYEYIAYREPDRWGTPRTVEDASVLAAAAEAYPIAWDTVDQNEGEVVCVPHTPGPVLYGIRGDDPGVVADVADRIESEPPATTRLFVTNQGTDAHLREGAIGTLEDGRAYRVTGTVAETPTTRRGGHVFFPLENGTASVTCAAFEPTKRFRDRVRALRAGDRITACGEVGDGTLKLEKFAVRSLRTTEVVVPTCQGCGRSMESAGADQGYRCRECGTAADGPVDRPLPRDLDLGWYEVPPYARRHVAKPLVRGGFDAPIHPER